MRAVVQRVTDSEVLVEGRSVGRIEKGFTVLLGVGEGDGEKDADYLANKIAGLRVFEDEAGKMNLSLKDAGGSVLAVSQFTLYGDARKGFRPSFAKAALPEEANKLYEYFCEALRSRGIHVEQGIFRAYMTVKITGDGPVTILIDSSKEF